MFDRWLGFNIHYYLQVLGVFILAFGIPMNKVLMSIGTIWVAANIIIKGDFKSYWKNWKNNLVFWFVISVLFIHLLGLTYTEDFNYALKDLNSKLPLFSIPIALIAFPINKKHLFLALHLFLASIIITSTINIYYFYTQHVNDYRELSRFGSHIRYALIVVTGILIAVFLWIKRKKQGYIYLLLILWLSYYTIISQVLSGYVAFVFLVLGLFIYGVVQKKYKVTRLSFAFLFLAITLFGLSYFYSALKPSHQSNQLENLPEKSKHGEVYHHDTLSFWYENENHILSYIAENELKDAWNQRSSINFDTLIENSYPLRSILIRYMASKGLTKDKEGMKQMSDEDITNVENGVSSILYTYPLFKRKIAVLKNNIFQYVVGGNPNGNSFLQRIEHWKAAREIIKSNWILGVGTGDIQEQFNEQYKAMNTQLHPDYWKRAHNQFLTFWVAFGIFGFILFTGFWILYLIKNIRIKNLIGIGFTLIAISSFLSEDTIETQQGVTYIALFLGLCSIMNSDIYRKENEETQK